MRKHDTDARRISAMPRAQWSKDAHVVACFHIRSVVLRLLCDNAPNAARRFIESRPERLQFLGGGERLAIVGA